MTRERKKAIEVIDNVKFQFQASLDEVDVDEDCKEAEEDNTEIVNALEMAIEVLKQESCEDVLDKIRDEVCDIDDEIVLNPDSFYERKVYVRFSKVIDIIDKYRKEQTKE